MEESSSACDHLHVERQTEHYISSAETEGPLPGGETAILYGELTAHIMTVAILIQPKTSDRQ